MRRWLSRLVWGAIQLGIVWVCFQVEFDVAQQTGKQPRYVFVLVMGILVAITFTVVCALIADGVKRMWWLVTGRKQAHISQPGSEQDSLSAPSGDAGKTLELPRSAWISKKPR